MARSMSRVSMNDRADSAAGDEQIPLPAFLQQSRTDILSTYVDLEWQQRNRLAEGLRPTSSFSSKSSTPTPSPWARLSGTDVTSRNRYINVEPFASRRIKLRVADGVNDYINASPITLGGRRYIATQGPKETSTSHFWRMVASETSNPAVVVMLTQIAEGGREKCFQYFPMEEGGGAIQCPPDALENDEVFEGQVSLVEKEEDSKCRTTVRKMKLRSRITREGNPGTWTEKDVYHLLFGGWPDFLVPEGEDRAALVELIMLSRRLNKDAVAPVDSSFDEYEDRRANGTAGVKEQNPRIVHCSAGVGRSGTFIALDHLLTMLDAGELDEVPAGTDFAAETVDTLRQQRMMMVQGESQFMFLYDVMREAWIERWREKHNEH